MHWSKWAVAAVLWAGIGATDARAQARLCTPDQILAFEDLADPARSDADQNDLVLQYNACSVVDEQGYLRSQEIHLAPLAAGASLASQLVLAQPGAVAAEILQGTSGSGTAEALPLDADGHAVVASATSDLFVDGQGAFLNTEGAVDTGAQPLVVRVEVAPGTVFVGGEIPEPQLALARPDEGVFIDDSTVLASNDQPLVARLPADFAWPLERVPLGQACPDALTWFAAVAGGCDPAIEGSCAGETWFETCDPGSTNSGFAPGDVATLEAPPTCDDGKQNQDETSTDVGGLLCICPEATRPDGDSCLYDTPGTYTFAVPEGVDALRIWVVGGGGGSSDSGGGGGGGAVTDTLFAVSGGQTFAVTVGAGGAGSDDPPGVAGGRSEFGDGLLYAEGGDGGPAGYGIGHGGGYGGTIAHVGSPGGDGDPFDQDGGGSAYGGGGGCGNHGPNGGGDGGYYGGGGGGGADNPFPGSPGQYAPAYSGDGIQGGAYGGGGGDRGTGASGAGGVVVIQWETGIQPL